MKKFIYPILGLLLSLTILAGIWYYYNLNKYAPATYVTDTTSSSTPTFAMSAVASHDNASSCYSVISGSVYDLTMWVNLHPGGKKAILSICGIDGTNAFMNQHGGKSLFMGILSRYKIGIINK